MLKCTDLKMRGFLASECSYILKRWHYLHHRHPGNFNVLFLLWDWILGTAAEGSEQDNREVAHSTWRVRFVMRDRKPTSYLLTTG